MSRTTPKNRGEKGRSTSAQSPSATQNLDVVDIVPGRLSESEWMSMLSQAEGEGFVADILDEFMNHLMVKCYEVYLKKQLLPFSVAWAKNAMVQVIELQYPTHDTGDGANTISLFKENAEPPPMITDSWAQGCMPVIRIPNFLQ
ncbi:hypothetical protein P4O66_012302, partial [Electrophorus voltai]